MDLFLKRSSNQDDVHPSIEAEAKMALMIIQHNTFFNLSDHMTQFIRSEFKDSKAGANFSCGRTKTAAIVNCLGNEFLKLSATTCKSSPLALC